MVGEKELMENEESINGLRRLGLNLYEAKAYLALVAGGGCIAGELAERAALPRPRVYDVLEKLQEKGFVVVQVGRPVKYAALPITEAVKTLKKQREAEVHQQIQLIDQLSGKLEELLKGASAVSKFNTQENLWTLKGRDAIYSKMASMVEGAENEIVLATTSNGLKQKMKYHGEDFEKAKKRGVTLTIIAPEAVKEAEKFNVQKKDVQTRLLLADNQALVFLTDENEVAEEEEVGLWIKSQHMIETLKKSV